MNELLDRLNEDFQNEEARYAYAESVANAYISEQIKRLREDRGLSQEELAAMIGTKQSGISRLQSRDYSAWKVETLRKLAKAFGVRLRISFEEFGTITDDIAGFNQGNLVPRKFAEDPAFKPQKTLDPRKFLRIHRSAIVNMDRVKGLQPWFHGDYRVVLSTGATLTLSRGYRKNLEDRILNH